MNKLLQHIIDAGDVDHKILPGLQKMQKAGIVMFKPPVNDKPVYDNIPNPAVVRAQVQRDAVAKQVLAKRAADQAAMDRHGYIRQAPEPRSMASKAWAIATNPMTAFAYKAQGRDIPDNFELGKKNSLDIAVNMVNPFAIVNSVASIPGNVARGEVLDAGLNALNLVPTLSAARQAGRFAKTAAPINKAIQRFGPNNSNKGFFNYITARGVEFDPGAILKDYKVGIQHGLAEAIPNTLGTVLRKTGIYPKARNVGRPFSEVFPRGAKKVEAIKAQDEGFDNAINFVNEYFYPGGSDELRPVLADKIRSLYPNITSSPENFSKLSDSNPFNLTPNKLVKSTSWGSGREGLDLFDLNYINKQRGSMEGFNNPESSAFTIRNYGPYYKRPIDIATTAVHEAGHTAQKLGYVPSFKNPAIVDTPITWGNEIASFDDATGNYKANLSTGLGKLYGKRMIEDGSWSASPLELHSELLAEKYTDYLRSLADKNKVSSSLRNVPMDKDLVTQVANPSDDVLTRILNRGNLDKHFKPETTLEDRLKLLKMLPAVAPVAAAGALGANQQRYGGENNMFRVFAQEGAEYKGPSIVDYLATKGYSGKKAFRKELADKYGIEGYDFSAVKNTQLLNKLRESDELLRQYDQTMTPVPVERMMQMEQQARAARQSAPQPNTEPVRRPAPVYNFSPEFQNMRIPQTKVNTSLQPKVIFDGKFSLKPKMVIPMPFDFNRTVPTSEVPNSEITDPINNTPARPRLTVPQFNPFAKPTVKPELGPFVSNRYNDVQEVDPASEQGAPEFLFNSEKLFNSFYRPKQKQLLPVVAANKPVVKTEKYTKPEVEELPWYEEAANAVTKTLKGFYDSFAESVEKSPLSFKAMNFGTPMSPQGAEAMTRDLTTRGLNLFSPDMAEKYNNWLNRQKAIRNMDKDPVSKIVVPDFDYAPMYITGDTIPDSQRQYHLPESMDLNSLRFGSRNRGDLTPIDTEAASITAFHPFVDSKSYFSETPDDPANSTYLGITPDGQIQVGGRKDFENKDVKISRVFSNKVVDFVKDQSGSIKKVPAGAKVNKNAFSPAVTVIDDSGKRVEGKLNLVVPQGNNADEAFGVATGGRFIFKTPDGQTRLVSGSLKNIEEEFKRIKGKNPYVTVVSLDNGSYSRGLRTKDQKLTAQDLRSYDNLNHGGGGNFAYLLPGQQTSRPLAKFDEFEKEATRRLQALYPGKKVSVGYQNTGLYDQSGGRDIQSQLAIQKQGNSQTPVSLHNFGAAKDYVLYVDGKPINADKDKKVYKDVLWNAADKVGMYHLEDWDPAHISLAKEGQKTAFDELKSKYPEIFTDPNFVKSLEFINKNKNNPAYQEYYELLNNIQPFTGAPRTTEFMKRTSTAKKAFGGPILDARGQWAHPGKVTRIPSSNITMQGVPYPVFGVGSNGQKQMMYPGQEYNFGGAQHVDEYPIMQGGGQSVYDNIPNPASIKNKMLADAEAAAIFTKRKIAPEKTTAENFMQGWLNSPMYNKMLEGKWQAPYIKEVRQHLFNKMNSDGKWQITDLNDDKNFLEKALGSKTLGDYTPSLRRIRLDNNIDPNERILTSIHEMSHATDSTPYRYFIPEEDASKMKKYYEAFKKVPKGLWNEFINPTDSKYNDYVSKPTETRARLNTIRYIGKKENIYDPYTEKIDKNKLKSINGDAIKQLKLIYSDDQIVDMLNSISQNKPNYKQSIHYAQMGGGLLSKSVTCSNCGWSWKASDGGSDPLTCHKCGGTVKMKNGGQHGGLDRWFAEKWVDVKTGKACGRQEGEKRAGYPACRPSKRVSSETPKTASEMSSAEKAKFKASKTSSQRINYNHKRNK